MTLSDMENKDDVFEALKALSVDSNMYIPPILESYLKKVAKSGRTNQSWESIKPLIIKKFQVNCEEFLVGGYPEQGTNSNRSSPKEINRLKTLIYNKLNEFENIPFTIQRISELLSDPQENYKRIDKYLRGLEKVVLVVSVVDQYGNKICDSNHCEFSDNGSFNESSELVTSDKADSNCDQNDIINDFYPIRENIEEIETRKIDIPNLVDSPVTWKSKSFNYASIHRTELNNSPTKPLNQNEAASESSESDLRPIGQLEAFVQNVGLNQSPTSASMQKSVSSNSDTPELAEDALELNKSNGDDLDKTEPMEDSDGNISQNSNINEEVLELEVVEENRKRTLNQVDDENNTDSHDVPESPCKQSKVEENSPIKSEENENLPKRDEIVQDEDSEAVQSEEIQPETESLETKDQPENAVINETGKNDEIVAIDEEKHDTKDDDDTTKDNSETED